MRTIGIMAGCVVLLSAVACRQRHLSEDFGRSYVRSFLAQQVRPPGTAPAEAITGLDSQEAAITADNYRAGLVPEGKTVDAEPTVIVAPPAREQATRLAPSVPKE
jgi:hypothetical protein